VRLSIKLLGIALLFAGVLLVVRCSLPQRANFWMNSEVCPVLGATRISYFS